jgi:hypothetical protein
MISPCGEERMKAISAASSRQTESVQCRSWDPELREITAEPLGCGVWGTQTRSHLHIRRFGTLAVGSVGDGDARRPRDLHSRPHADLSNR